MREETSTYIIITVGTGWQLVKEENKFPLYRNGKLEFTEKAIKMAIFNTFVHYDLT